MTLFEKVALVLSVILGGLVGWMSYDVLNPPAPEDQYKLYRACLQNQDCIKSMETEDWLEYYRLKWELEDD